MRFSKYLPVLFIIILFSCDRQPATDSDIHPLVADILFDKLMPEHEILVNHAEPSVRGSIYIIGGENACKALSSAFQKCDAFDNVNGRHVSDGLPDFSGETICMVIDDAAYPYWDYVQNNGQERMREHFIRQTISSLDTLCNLSRYDLDGRGYRAYAKMIIVADPYYLSWGKKDVDYMFGNIGCGIPVVQPSDLLFDSLLSDGSTELNVGIICDSVFTRSSVYVETLKSKSGNQNASCFASSPVQGKSALISFLELYRQNGGRTPLDAILVEDISIDMDALRKDIALVRDLKRPEYLTYGKFLSENLRVIESSEVMTAFCYNFLRSSNLFTHKIAYPKLLSFRTYPHPDESIHSSLILQSDDVQD